ncbi:hypothetical protein GWI33_008534 [Rhynchophorus ferrugineus]|uniref:rhomboid protease n=1 Tax=Rhynchophorus ferrugineus TaxID=354439 RepID=A0A834IFZ4_RHYFE|nr:hypothetical protein GWI33_008534 [Rhynchophorus ferrugineus]
MALNHLGRFWLCKTKATLFKNITQEKPTKLVRHFRKAKSKIEAKEPQVNPGSLETPFSNVYVGSGDLNSNKLWKPLIFTIGFSGASFVGCAIWEYERMRSNAISALKRPIKFFKRKADISGSEKTNNYLINLLNALTKETKNWWNTLTPGQKMFMPICAFNILVFAAWRIPRFQPFMLNYFASNPASPNQCLPMILSTFSHYSGFHLLANMYVLHSFSTGAVHSLGKEQFLALYLSSGVISSFTSYFYKIVTKQPGLSLGASGAIMAVLGYVSGAAIKFIVGLDTAGVLLGWKFFDHAAHLGGAVTGIVWALWGNQNLWPKREPVLRYWHQLRGSIR